jgi:hypothetical protein
MYTYILIPVRGLYIHTYLHIHIVLIIYYTHTHTHIHTHTHTHTHTHKHTHTHTHTHKHTVSGKNLFFSTDVESAVRDAEIIFVSVHPTPYTLNPT